MWPMAQGRFPLEGGAGPGAQSSCEGLDASSPGETGQACPGQRLRSAGCGTQQQSSPPAHTGQPAWATQEELRCADPLLGTLRPPARM